MRTKLTTSNAPITVETIIFLPPPTPSSRNKNPYTWTNGNGEIAGQIGYIAVSSENRDWVTNARATGVANPNSSLRYKTIQIDIKYDVIRSEKQNNNNDNIHINVDIKRLRGNTAHLKRSTIGNKHIQELLQNRATHRKINRPKEQTPEQEQETDASDKMKIWLNIANIRNDIQQESPIIERENKIYQSPKYNLWGGVKTRGGNA